MATIEVTDLRKEFDVRGGTEVAVDDVSLSIEDGEFVSIVGPSGCGKTTTLRCIAGLEIPTSGTIEFEGVDVTEVPANRRNLAMMFQNIALYPHMSILENIAYPLKIHGVAKSERHETAREAAELVQIDAFVEKYPGELSGGQRQRAALARTIVQDPIAFLMDEPLSDLDAQLKVEMRKEIQRVHKRMGKPTIYVTHDQEEALTMSDRIVVLNEGRIEQYGTTGDVYNTPANTFVAKFIGNPSINFLDGTVDTVDGRDLSLAVHDGRFRLAADRFGELHADQPVTVGIRPQNLRIDHETDDADFVGELSLLEPVDDRAHATIDGPDGELRAVVPVNKPLREDERVGITLDESSLYLFDVNGDLIAKSADESAVVPEQS